MKQKKHFLKIITIFILIFSFFLFSNTAEAAKNVKSLKPGKSYTTKLTGSKRHKVKYTFNEANGTVKLFINGKCVKSLKNTWWPEVCLLKITDSKNLIYIHDCGPSDDTGYVKIYEYKNQKLKLLADLLTITQKKYANRIHYAMLQSVTSEKITVKWQIQSNSLGSSFEVKIPYKIGKTKITRSGTSYNIKQWDGKVAKFTANRKIKVYTKAGGDKLAFIVKKGQKVTITKIYGKNGKTYFQLKNKNGKTGWYKDPDNYVNGGFFKECFFSD